MSNPKNSSSLAFVVLVWTTLLGIWAWTSLKDSLNNLDDFKLKTVDEITHGSP